MAETHVERKSQRVWFWRLLGLALLLVLVWWALSRWRGAADGPPASQADETIGVVPSYLEIALDRETLHLARPRKVLVPIGLVWLDQARKIVCLGLGEGELIAGQCARAAPRLEST